VTKVREYLRVLAEAVPDLEGEGWRLAALGCACEGMLATALVWREVIAAQPPARAVSDP
jgi:hypothetical protein